MHMGIMLLITKYFTFPHMGSRIELGGSRTFSIENVLVPPTPILLCRLEKQVYSALH